MRQIVASFLRKVPRSVQRDDLEAAGMAGLWDAIRRGPEQQPEGFDWYIRVRIRGAIQDELRAQDWMPRRTRARAAAAIAAGLPEPRMFLLDDLSAFEQNGALTYDDSSADVSVSKSTEFSALALAIAELPERLQHILHSQFRGETLRQIADRLGVTEARISQLRTKAIALLRKSSHFRL